MEANSELSTPHLAVVALWAPDDTKAAHFYRDVVGLKLLPYHGGRPHFDIGGTYLTIVRGTPRPAEDAMPARFPLIALRVRHLEEAVARLESAGVQMPWGIEGEAGSRWVMFKDPAGNLVEFVESS
jgi:catechol 2,3-dioxygenase-like lactoylglutathione lyase family enzyme